MNPCELNDATGWHEQTCLPVRFREKTRASRACPCYPKLPQQPGELKEKVDYATEDLAVVAATWHGPGKGVRKNLSTA